MPPSRALRSPVKASLTLFCVILTLQAQTYTGQITGVVSDPSDAAIAGAVIKIVNKQTGVAFTANSNSEGLYRLLSVPPGEYKVNVRASGFEQSSRDSV